uniref:Minor capsid protein L2 n=1 Tax=Human papillomavirus type 16 TaxID=333760 RepID=J3T1F1_HPV16|nr:L2 protein [Human papillomavirus 16]
MRHKRSAKRTKRASATQLYKTCKQAGTCPPDIIPKVEGKTIADQILQYGSMGVFFGGLGIGTGSGTGGRTGYIPLGTRPPTATDTLAPVRPPLTVDPVGPSDPSIVSLVEETSFIDAGAPTSVPSIPPDVSGFSITTSTDTTPAILDINNTVTTVTTHNNPTFTDPSVLQPPTPAETGGHFTLSSSTISTHNYEEIPMDTFIVSTNPNTVTSSTPIPGSRPVARLGLYSRTTQQVKVVDPAFVTTPTKLITYDNPAYEGIDVDNTLYFPSNDNSINIAPDPDFLDIVALHRPALTSRRTGIRYSRIGNKQTLRTRSGKSIGAKVHYYYDLSTIDPAEEIELQTITPSTYTTTSHAASPTSINNGLYDIYADDFITDTSTTPVPSVPSTSLSGYIPANTTIPFGGAYNIPLVSGPDIPINITDQAPSLIPIVPGSPQYTIIADAGDFYLHPSYYMLRKRRKRLPYFFSNVSLAA